MKDRIVQTMCQNGRIDGAKKFGRDWAIPIDAKRSVDKRIVVSHIQGKRMAFQESCIFEKIKE